ncbi:hypothetical protein OCU04_012912 [Sclerotinia nivalis]|uniref:Retrotransposon gag domain-containing protein n=1 Tax=Sclerotinia nivalis TaxID=352851 RepID=A0A9X0DC78_9HELO|nr:hypothetical protein OCU04_012912 [Sclerotinia nivalis]
MSSCPYPPNQPGFSEEFATAVASDIAIWYCYLTSFYEFSIRMETEVIDLQSTIQKLILDLQVEKTVFIRWKEENDRLITHLIQLYPVPVALLVSTPTDLTDPSLLISVTTPTIVPVLSKPQLSEKVSDPALFDGTKIDLDRFVDQIQNKMYANSDRFTSPHSRLTYITGRLTGPAATQIRPYNIKGQFVKFVDYEDLLQILERVYGNQNKRAEVWKLLINLKQRNQSFYVFYTEFQRLALEAGMADDNSTLVILLEQTLSSELKNQIVTAELSTDSTDVFATFV